MNNFHRHLLLALLYSGVLLGVYFLLQPVFGFDEADRSRYQLMLSRLWFIIGLVHLIAVIFQQRKSVPQELRTFFLSPGSGLNLAVFRIIYFGFVGYGVLAIVLASGAISLTGTEFALEKFIWGDLPKSSRIPLPFMEWYIMHVPINLQLAKTATILLLTSGFLCMIGLFTRVSALVHVVAAFYILGVPNFFGKVNHSHFQVWLPLIFAFSPCADRLSLDALIWKRKSPGQAVQYGLPIKLFWVILGTLYFFPGFWKIWNAGFDWAFKDNLLHQMYFKWIELRDWQPLFQIDKAPNLLRLLAFSVIVWELVFIILILRPATRLIAVIEGLLFHFSTWAFMNILFMGLVFCYASFVDWERIWNKISGSGKSRKHPPGVSPTPSMNSLLPVSIAGVFIISMNIFTGFGNVVSWPFACYPTFEAMVGSRTQVVQFYTKGEDNQLIKLEKEKLIDLMNPERYRALEHRIILSYPYDSTVYNNVLQTIADIWILNFPEDLSDSLIIYLDKIPIAPDSMHFVLQREYLTTFAKTDLLPSRTKKDGME